MTLQNLSQNDPQWKNEQLGSSDATIGSHGCTITAIAIKFGVTPKFLNERLNAVDGYAPSNKNNPYDPQKNLVIWKKLEEALPGVKFKFRYGTYDEGINQIVKENLPCVVEVNAAPIGGVRHWVLYIGNGQLIDPWDGKTKLTTAYEALGVAILEGEYIKPQPQPSPVQQVAEVIAPVPNENMYKGLDLTNKESMKVAVDIWSQVVHEGKYIDINEYNKVVEELRIVKEQRAKEVKLSEPDQRYVEMSARGFSNINDVVKVLDEKDKQLTGVKKQLIDVLKDNETVHRMLADKEQQDYTAIEAGEGACAENKKLKEQLAQVVEATGAERPNINEILNKVFIFRNVAERVFKQQEKTEAPSKNESKRSTSFNFDWLAQMFSSEEVSKAK